jgi:hypothetical protein
MVEAPAFMRGKRWIVMKRALALAGAEAHAHGQEIFPRINPKGFHRKSEPTADSCRANYRSVAFAALRSG